jgi:hypothetical protein
VKLPGERKRYGCRFSRGHELRSEHAIGAPSNRWRCVFPLLSGDFDALILGCHEASRLVALGEGRSEQFAEIAGELRCPAVLMK